ncbi:MAG: HipA domain-containing protein [Cryobacterium sp.]|nr:HipA domain-containing protein [Cryobacterium sp.]
MTTPTIQNAADVYKAGRLAARMIRSPLGIDFHYHADYLASKAPAIASTLPLSEQPRITPAGAVAPYFAGLLPEGRRLTALRQTIKTSADDELSLLVAVGADTIGDVQVVSADQPLPAEPESIQLEAPLESIRFAEVLEQTSITGKPPTIAGVQDKASASMISLPLKLRHERYILKLNPPEYPHLVENENHFLEWSRAAGISTTKARIFRDADDVPGLLVTRFDRVSTDDASRGAKGSTTKALAVEDAAQALDRWPADKYNVSFEQAAHALMRLCAAPLIAAQGILQQLVFAWLTGNGDLHAKNLSVLTTAVGDTRLSPAYDLPSTLFYGDTTMALTVGGKDTLNLHRLHEFGSEIGLRAAAIDRIVGAILAKTESLIESIDSLPFDRRLRDKVARQLTSRRRDFGG